VSALDRHLFVAFDPGPLVADIAAGRRDAVLRRADMVSLNEREADALGGTDGVMELVRADATVVIRQGRLGAAIHEARFEWLQIPAVALDDVRDTSGAGDVHVGANLAGLAQGLSWRDAVLLANRAAAYAVSRDGPASGPTAAQLENFGVGRW
jgi:sugar/nucleoside kinase (ribokinase family)